MDGKAETQHSLNHLALIELEKERTQLRTRITALEGHNRDLIMERDKLQNDELLLDWLQNDGIKWLANLLVVMQVGNNVRVAIRAAMRKDEP